MNDNIIPYIPIAPRVQSKTEKSHVVCQRFFEMIDQCVAAQISFNHDTQTGCLSISPDQINDLLAELSKHEHSHNSIDIQILKQSLNDLIYPRFNGELTVTSPIWNKEEVRVWQFQLNQIANGVNMEISRNEAEQLLDSSISALRIWRQSLEATKNNPEVTYSANDLVYKLLDLEVKLQKVQRVVEQ